MEVSVGSVLYCVVCCVLCVVCCRLCVVCCVLWLEVAVWCVTGVGNEALLVTGYKGGKMGDMSIQSHKTGVS